MVVAERKGAVLRTARESDLSRLAGVEYRQDLSRLPERACSNG